MKTLYTGSGRLHSVVCDEAAFPILEEEQPYVVDDALSVDLLETAVRNEFKIHVIQGSSLVLIITASGKGLQQAAEMKAYETSAPALLFQLYVRRGIASLPFAMEDYIDLAPTFQNASERFIEYSQYNTITQENVLEVTRTQAERAVSGIARLEGLKDWIAGHSEESIAYMITFTCPTFFMQEAFKWRRETELVGKPEICDFLMDYPYILNGRRDVGQPVGLSLADSLLFVGVLSSKFKDSHPVVGLVSREGAEDSLSKWQ